MAGLQEFAEKALAEFVVNPLRLHWVGGSAFMTWRDYKENFSWTADESRYLAERKEKLGRSIIFTGD